MEGLDFLQEVTKMVFNSELISDPEKMRKRHRVVDFRHPRDLENILNLEVSNEPAKKEDLLKFCQEVIQYSVKTSHPQFVSRLYKGIDGYGLAGSWLTDALNTNQTTYEVAPVFTLLEKALLQTLINIMGWDDGDGVFSPGGSLGNMYGIALGRFKISPDVKQRGVRHLPPLVSFISEEAHYSLKKGASFLGLGIENVIPIKADDRGRIIPEELEKAIIKSKEEGKVPFFVCATSGTTVLGAYDPLVPLGDICKRHSLWLHIDAAWGGSAIFSSTQRHLLAGIEGVDSVTLDLHKMAGIPFQCSVFITRHKGILYQCNSLSAEYLFQPDTYYDTCYDVGDESIQCSRKVDSLKFWLSWRGRGKSGVEKQVDNAFAMAKYLADRIRSTEGFRLVLPEFECTNICFWYIPPSLRGKEEAPDFWEKLAKVAPQIKARLVTQGTLMICYQPLGTKKLCNFLRVTVHCIPEVTEKDMDYILSEVQRVGVDM